MRAADFKTVSSRAPATGSQPGATIFLPAGHSLEILRGCAEIQRHAAEIAALRQRTGQASNPLTELGLYLRRVEVTRRNRPVVLLVRSGYALEGAVYLNERMFCGVSTGYLRGLDPLSGESSVVAAAPFRPGLLRYALGELFSQTGARIAYAAVSVETAIPSEPEIRMTSGLGTKAGSISRRHRVRLGNSFDETLSRFGPRMRRNLRYYRRRAADKLGAEFCPALTVAESDEAIMQLTERGFSQQTIIGKNRPAQQFLRAQPGYFSMGVRAGGAWLSHLAGLRRGKVTCVFQQMNSTGFEPYSLATVMRSHLFEHEIGLGQTEIKFVNGTCAFFQQCCEPDQCLTVTVSRGLPAWLIMNWIAPWYNPCDHGLNIHRAQPEARLLIS